MLEQRITRKIESLDKNYSNRIDETAAQVDKKAAENQKDPSIDEYELKQKLDALKKEILDSRKAEFREQLEEFVEIDDFNAYKEKIAEITNDLSVKMDDLST